MYTKDPDVDKQVANNAYCQEYYNWERGRVTFYYWDIHYVYCCVAAAV